MTRYSKNLLKISSERILNELYGILCSRTAYETLNDCKDVINYIIPGFMPHRLLKKNTGDFALKLFSCIYTQNYSTVCQICNELKLNREDKSKIQNLHIILHEKLNVENGRIVFDKKVKKLLCDVKTEYIRDLFILTDTDTTDFDLFLEKGIYTKNKLAVTGGEIASSGIFAKHLTSKILHSVMYSVACGDLLNNKESILEYIRNLDTESLE